MLQTLEMCGYRGFESYRLTNLARVNLVVGKNNCGKTSVLEAIALLVSGGHPAVFSGSSRRRGEVGVPKARHSRGRRLDVSHVFFGHTFDLGASFELSSGGGEFTLSVRVLSLDEVSEDADYWDRRRRQRLQRGLLDHEEEAAPVFGLSVDGGEPERQMVAPLMEDGTVSFDSLPMSIRDRAFRTPVQFLTVESVDFAYLGGMWDAVLSEGREEEIVDDMRLLEPNLDSIHFLTSGRTGSGILVGLRDGGRRLPIGTYGDGMRRLLALRLSFVWAANGFLLIDEIDTGLHWTVMEEMWQFVIEVARKLNVQILATTHSYDCIRGVGSLIRSQPELTDQVSIQKVDRSLKQAVCLRGDQIKVAVEQDIEVR